MTRTIDDVKRYCEKELEYWNKQYNETPSWDHDISRGIGGHIGAFEAVILFIDGKEGEK
jgi:hypothetical protein